MNSYVDISSVCVPPSIAERTNADIAPFPLCCGTGFNQYIQSSRFPVIAHYTDQQSQHYYIAQLQLPIILISNVDKQASDASVTIDTEQGQQLAKLLGESCVFVETSIATMNNGQDIVDKLVKMINEKDPRKIKPRPSSANSVKSIKKPVVSKLCTIL